MSLRGLSIGFGVVMTALGAAIAVALMVLTTYVHDGAREMRGTVESLRAGQELELALVAVRDAKSGNERWDKEQVARRALDDIGRRVSSADEQRIVQRLVREVDDFVARAELAPGEVVVAPAAIAVYDTAFGTVRELMRLHVAQSREMENVVSQWDSTADVLGAAGIVLLLMALAGFAWLFRRMAVRPALRLVGVIERYARGDHVARAVEEGPEEFRTIASTFNGMATTLERQRTDQLAFLAGVAHDLRNPLSALKLATSMISPDEPLPSEARMRNLFGRVDKQIDRLQRMVDDFLDAARIESGELELKIETCDANELARTILDLFEPANRTHRLEAKLPNRPVPLACDPVRIEQVLANLVSNAIKYSPRDSLVMLTVTAHADRVELSVTDAGIGIAAADIEQLFQPFRRAEGAKDVVPGVGIGLFVARRIVEAHRGHIHVKSEPGRGATFTVELPLGP